MSYYQYIFIYDLTSNVTRIRKYITTRHSNAIELNFSPLRILCACIDLGEIVTNVKKPDKCYQKKEIKVKLT